MFLLVLTDFCCWVPIGALSVLVQAGVVEVHPVAYAWIATFILPINSSINPFLYTVGDVIAGKASCSCKPGKGKPEKKGETEMMNLSVRTKDITPNTMQYSTSATPLGLQKGRRSETIEYKVISTKAK